MDYNMKPFRKNMVSTNNFPKMCLIQNNVLCNMIIFQKSHYRATYLATCKSLILQTSNEIS